jgi:hypothetical protein
MHTYVDNTQWHMRNKREGVMTYFCAYGISLLLRPLEREIIVEQCYFNLQSFQKHSACASLYGRYEEVDIFKWHVRKCFKVNITAFRVLKRGN